MIKDKIDYSVFTHQELQGLCSQKDRQIEGERINSRKVQADKEELNRKINEILQYIERKSNIGVFSKTIYDTVLDIALKNID